MDRPGIFRYSVDGQRRIRITSSTGLAEATFYVLVCVAALWVLTVSLFVLVPTTPALGFLCFLARTTDPVVLPWGAWYELAAWPASCLCLYIRAIFASAVPSGMPPISATEERRWQAARARGLVTEDEFRLRRFNGHAVPRYDSFNTGFDTPQRAIAQPRSRRNSQNHSSTRSFSSSVQTLRAYSYESQGAVRVEDSDDEDLVWMAQTFARSFEQARDPQNHQHSPDEDPSQVTSGRNSRSASPVLSRMSLRPGSSGSSTQRPPRSRDNEGSQSRTPSRPSSVSFGCESNDYVPSAHDSPYKFRGDMATDWPTIPRSSIYGHARNVSTSSLASVPEVQQGAINVLSSQRPSRKRSRTAEYVRSLQQV